MVAVVEPVEFVVVTLASIVVSAMVLTALWRWARDPRRLLALSAGIAFGVVGWNLLLNLTNASAMNVDSAYRVSGQDVGSGVFAFSAASLVLGLVVDRREPAWRVVGAAALAGLITIVVDLFA